MSESLHIATAGTRPRRRRLWAELAVLFVGVPILMTVFFGQYPLFVVLLALTAVAAGLLALTPGFDPAELRRGPVLGEWRLILGFTALVGAVSLATAWALVPEWLFAIPLHRPELWVSILVLYPLVSALPQELIYRPLFFRRYGHLFPGQTAAITANAVLFGIGHLFFMNPVTIALTVAAGAVFAWVYVRTGSFLLVTVLHGIAGNIVFTVGLGRFFYHGAVGG